MTESESDGGRVANLAQSWSQDTVMNGKVALRQPIKGYRAGLDAALLAACCDAVSGQRVVEAGKQMYYYLVYFNKESKS